MLATFSWTSSTIPTKSPWEASSLSILEVKSATSAAAAAEKSLPSDRGDSGAGEVGAKYGGLFNPAGTPLVNGWFLNELGDCNGWFLSELGDCSALLFREFGERCVGEREERPSKRGSPVPHGLCPAHIAGFRVRV